MKKLLTVSASALLLFGFLSLSSCQKSVNNTSATEADSLRKQIKEILASQKIVDQNITKFDTLDFNVFSRRDWSRFHESHANDIKVHFPDGHITTGLDIHIKDMEAMFVYAPDTRITAHPIKLGSGNITAVTGIMEGTFTKPMPIGNGKVIQPTGKAFKIPMATFGIWKDGVMTEEYLYWDNKTYMDQMGIGK
ncbi:ester cyclase [Chryseobacterium sp.]|uniref:ester cyclase n=1 Tax=Chryseobacterium sp. TaxID=1871047 RepID=UPI001B260718|nr:ester cyclase [Chryseobacterium sp.]MBO9691685.1 ester cyclase [Chryseobacterium sp.]